MGKTQHETSLLMSVIGALSNSKSNEQRDKEKARLEKEYRVSDQRLDQLIAEKYKDLSLTMGKFTQISAKLTICRQKILTIRENVTACKELLNCKRDEVKKLWLEGIEHKHTVYLLQEIEQIKDVTVRINNYTSQKHFLHATELLVSSIKKLDGDLAAVEGLRDIKTELQEKKILLYEQITDELLKHLYIRSTHEINTQQNEESLSTYRRKKGLLSPKKSDKRNYLEVSSTSTTPTHKYKQPLQILSNETFPQVEEDLTLEDPEEDSPRYVSILIECLTLLDCTSDAVDVIKNRMEKELQNLVTRTAKQIYEEEQSFKGEDLSRENQPQLLLKLLQLLFDQFTCVARAHEYVLSNLNRALVINQLNVPLFRIGDVWSKIQDVLQVLLSDYLDMQNSSSSQPHSSITFRESNTDLSSYFKKKGRQLSKNQNLFTFENSSQSLSKKGIQEQRQWPDVVDGNDETVKQEKYLVTCADARNIIVIFKPLMDFINRIESNLGYLEGNHCLLHSFVMNYVKETFVTRINETVSYSLDEANKNLDAWVIADAEMHKLLNVSKPLLASTVIVERSIDECKQLMFQLPHYSDRFLNMIVNTLIQYRDMCENAFKGVVQPESADKRIISATWAQDENISQFLRMLPNWKNLQQLKNNKTPDYEESHEEIRLRNVKESEMLIENIGVTLIPQHETLDDVALLRVLALLQESLEWFGDQVSKFAYSLPSKNAQSGSQTASPVLNISPVAENTTQTLLQLSRDFMDLADKCLLILHLEVRVHCFYFLLPLFIQGNFTSWALSQSPDAGIGKLNQQLALIESALRSALSTRKFKYVFEGLGQLNASIMINSAQWIKRINENGIKKMCLNILAIQQTLTNITASREVALDHAREYYEMLYLPIEDIFNKIVDQGKQFTELEYTNAVVLLHRSNEDIQPDGDPVELSKNLERLNEILTEVTTNKQNQQNSL